jgi:hypothetical protein
MPTGPATPQPDYWSTTSQNTVGETNPSPVAHSRDEYQMPRQLPAPTAPQVDTAQVPPVQQPVASPGPAPSTPSVARPHLSSNTSPVTTHDGPAAPTAPDHIGGFQLLHWIAVMIAALFFVQLVSLLMRPLRRALVLRHLRRPFWTETVDQRVSNAWQLVLVGLRDAGWRSDGGEAPREIAKRVGVAGVEDCATILDRARHGIRIDREDLATMVSSADAAYRTARTKVGRISRTIAWLRWPLV